MQGINKAINQKKFTSEYHKSIVSIIYVFHLIKNNQHQLLHQHKITEQQYNILRILRGARPEPCTIGILKERMLDKMSDASRLVDRLVAMKLAVRTQNRIDKRISNVVITDSGLAVLAEIDKYKDEHEKVLRCLTTEESQSLNNLLDKIIDYNS